LDFLRKGYFKKWVTLKRFKNAKNGAILKWKAEGINISEQEFLRAAKLSQMTVAHPKTRNLGVHCVYKSILGAKEKAKFDNNSKHRRCWGCGDKQAHGLLHTIFECPLARLSHNILAEFMLSSLGISIDPENFKHVVLGLIPSRNIKKQHLQYYISAKNLILKVLRDSQEIPTSPKSSSYLWACIEKKFTENRLLRQRFNLPMQDIKFRRFSLAGPSLGQIASKMVSKTRRHFSDPRSLKRALLDTKVSELKNKLEGHSQLIPTIPQQIRKNWIEKTRLLIFLDEKAQEMELGGGLVCQMERFREAVKYNRFITLEQTCLCLKCVIQRFRSSPGFSLCCSCSHEKLSSPLQNLRRYPPGHPHHYPRPPELPPSR
jgi:hypothetical protein